MFKSIWQRTRHDPSTLIAAVGLGAVVALAICLAPAGLVEPLAVARGLLALVAGTVVATGFLMLLAVLDQVVRDRRRRARAALAADSDAPPLRAHDSHPDAPARRPLSAADLQTLEPVIWPSFRMAADGDVLELIRPEPEPQPELAMDERPTLGELLARLEFGVERRARAWPDPANAPPLVPDQMLHEALDAMRKTA